MLWTWVLQQWSLGQSVGSDQVINRWRMAEFGWTFFFNLRNLGELLDARVLMSCVLLCACWLVLLSPCFLGEVLCGSWFGVARGAQSINQKGVSQGYKCRKGGWQCCWSSQCWWRWRWRRGFSPYHQRERSCRHKEKQGSAGKAQGHNEAGNVLHAFMMESTIFVNN